DIQIANLAGRVHCRLQLLTNALGGGVWQKLIEYAERLREAPDRDPQFVNSLGILLSSRTVQVKDDGIESLAHTCECKLANRSGRLHELCRLALENVSVWL